MVFEFLFELPVAVLIIFFFGYLNQKRISIYYIFLSIAALILVTLTFSMTMFLKVWMPGPGITIYLALGILYFEMYKNPIYESLGQIEFPNRFEIKAALNHGGDIEEKQKIYLDYMKQSSMLWAQREKALNLINSKILLINFVLTFSITFTVVAILEWKSSSVTNLFTEAIVFLRKTLENYSGKETVSQIPFLALKGEALKNYLREVMNYGASIGFVLNTLVVLFVSYIFRASFRVLKKKNVTIGSMTNFVLPEYTIFLVIIGGALTLMTSTWNLDFILSFTGKNLLIIGLFLYVLSGYSIFRLYIRVRFLPLTRLSLIVFLICFLISNYILLALLILFYLGIGLISFRIDLRKKALQPKGVSFSL